jgi:ABC-type transporter Mla MlaB component
VDERGGGRAGPGRHGGNGVAVLAFAIRGPISRADLPGLCARVCGLLHGSAGAIAHCDVRGVDADAVTADALARLQLGARRHGCEVSLCNASSELLALLAFMGLDAVVPDCGYASSRAGTPNSGNSVAVPRKNVNSAILPPDSSSTWSAHGS